MTEKNTELARRLVIGHKKDGRCCYDKAAKRELIEACLRPGVSVARMALQYGINANLLRTWIAAHQRRGSQVAIETKALAASPAFVPVVAAPITPRSSGLGLSAQLPNGVRIDLGEVAPDILPTVLTALNALPCSGSTRS
jgi:transposase